MKKLAIVGASGLVGQTVLKILKEEKLLQNYEIFMLSSNRSAGKVLIFGDKHYRLFELSDEILKLNFDYAIFLTGEDVSKVWCEKFAKTGTIVIDNSSAFRMKKDVPLIVPEINFNSIKKYDKIIANPNCSTIQLVLVLDKLRKLASFENVVVSSYQSVSGAGRDALFDLENNTSDFFEMGIKNNFIAKIGSVNENGFCSEENKIMLESQKILNEKFNIIATTVRVPISVCHGESVYVKFSKDVDFEKVKAVLNCDYIKVSDDMFYPTVCSGTNETYVFRLRKQSDREILFFVIADNLRRGAGFNAVEILKRLG